MADQHKNKPKDTNYFVNSEEETTTEDKLSVRQILESGEFTPIEDYKLASENPPEDYGEDYDREIDIHPNQRFQAQFKGQTPTS